MEILNLYHFLYTLIKRIWLKFNCKKIGLVGSVSKWQLKSNKCAASHSLSYVCHRRRCRLLLASSLSLSLSPLCFGLLSADSTPFPHQLLSKAVQSKDNPSKPTILKSVLSHFLRGSPELLPPLSTLPLTLHCAARHYRCPYVSCSPSVLSHLPVANFPLPSLPGELPLLLFSVFPSRTISFSGSHNSEPRPLSFGFFNSIL